MTEDTHKYTLAEFAADFGEAAGMYNEYDKDRARRIDATMSAEEIAEQRALFQAQLFEPGNMPTADAEIDRLADIIIRFNENSARIMLREMKPEELASLIPPKRRNRYVSEAFLQKNCPTLARLFDPSPF